MRKILQASSWPAEDENLLFGATDVLGAAPIAARESAERTIAVAILPDLFIRFSLSLSLCV